LRGSKAGLNSKALLQEELQPDLCASRGW